MTPEERLAAAAWAATQEIAGSSAHRARLDEAVEIMAPAETWNELKQAWSGTEMPTTVAPWGASADRRAAETVVLTGAKFQGPDLPVAAALASHWRSVLAAEADPFFGCTAGAPDWGGEAPPMPKLFSPEHELSHLRNQNARLRAELRTMRAVINAALGE